jgi:hypothetical protein
MWADNITHNPRFYCVKAEKTPLTRPQALIKTPGRQAGGSALAFLYGRKTSCLRRYTNMHEYTRMNHEYLCEFVWRRRLNKKNSH